MNDPIDPTQTPPEPSPAPRAVGFCQNCGTSLTSDTIRKVGTAVYCEPCLAARIGVPQGVPIPGNNAGYGPVRPGAFPPNGSWVTSNLSAPGPNPGLAALLGLIPGVGAMYNEQYAKGIIHLVVFAVLVSLADNVNGVFGLFVAGWIFYMAIEAHHTARARRDGTPLPNPFGLNDIGERLGFGKAWPSGPTVTEVANDAAAAASAGFHAASTGPVTRYSSPTPPQTPPPTANWGAPAEPYNAAAYKQQFVDAAYQQAYRDMGYAPPVPPVPPAMPYTPVPPYDPASFTPVASRFPAGAVWLIALGVIFLMTTTGIFNGVPGEALVGCVLLGLAVWMFLRRMMDSGATLANDGSAAHRFRILRALRFSVWLGLIGTLFLLDSLHILTWHHSWPFLIILPGVLALVERTAYQSAPTRYIPPSPVASTPTATETADTTSGGK